MRTTGRLERPAVVLVTTWILGVCTFARLLVGAAPGAALIDIPIFAAIGLWVTGMLGAVLARRRREVMLDAAVELLRGEDRRETTVDARIGER